MIKYSDFQPEQAEEVSRLIRLVYDEFVAPGYPEEGNRNFYTVIDPQIMTERFRNPGHFILTATEGGRIIGVIAVRDNNHIALMFVDKVFHRRGISRQLMTRAEKRIAEETGKGETTVFSSPYAVPVYRSLGFIEEGPEQQRDGIIFQPMKHCIPSV